MMVDVEEDRGLLAERWPQSEGVEMTISLNENVSFQNVIQIVNCLIFVGFLKNTVSPEKYKKT